MACGVATTAGDNIMIVVAGGETYNGWGHAYLRSVEVFHWEQRVWKEGK